jgi:hypothetical protein
VFTGAKGLQMLLLGKSITLRVAPIALGGRFLANFALTDPLFP